MTTYYLFDAHGAFAGTSSTQTPRSTPIAPAQQTSDYIWNFAQWVYAPNSAAPLVSGAAPVSATDWLLDLGAYYDRFGAEKMAVLTSTDPVIQAFIKDAQARAWIDLKRPEVHDSLVYMSTVIPALTPERIDSILNTPPTAEENRVLHTSYF